MRAQLIVEIDLNFVTRGPLLHSLDCRLDGFFLGRLATDPNCAIQDNVRKAEVGAERVSHDRLTALPDKVEEHLQHNMSH